MNMITYSKLESQRFNKNIHRGNLDTLDIKKIKAHILTNEVDVSILRFPSLSIAKHCKLKDMGFDVLHADTLVHYEANLTNIEPRKLKNDIVFEKVDSSNLHILEEIVPIIFKDYSNHYFSNPLFNPNDIRDGYVEWASSYNSEFDPNKVVWIACIDSEVAGFLTCTYNEIADESEGVLYGVLPSYSGRGIYSDFIRFSEKHFKEIGCLRMRVSTQIQNYAVQKVWAREGFFLKESYETYHINSCLSYSLENFPLRTISFSKEYPEIFGLKSIACHSALINTYFSKILETEYPGNESVYLDEHSVFLKPIYPNVEYVIETSLLEKQDNGLIKILFKVKKDNQINILSYNVLSS